jgi:cob(I)alamin adenosyltransferase
LAVECQIWLVEEEQCSCEALASPGSQAILKVAATWVDNRVTVLHFVPRLTLYLAFCYTSIEVARESAETLPVETSIRGLVELFTGDGKGKTSAALGVGLRALGHGHRVHIVFFMKGDFPYGEQKTLSELSNITFERFGFRDFVDPANVKPAEREEAHKALEAARKAMLSLKYDVVILDEVNVAIAWKLIDIDEVIKLIHNKPDKVELILTGRYADPKLVELADLVTDMVKVKHPYDKGILSRKGIDY